MNPIWDIGTHWGNIRVILGLYGDNAKEHGNYCSIWALYKDNGKEHGNYFSLGPAG